MSAQCYYDLLDDMLVPERWVLDDPEGGNDWLDPSRFTTGKPANTTFPITFGLLKEGRPLDYSTSPAGVPVVTQRAADVLAAVCGPQVQLIEVAVKGHPGPFFIANATCTADCVDEQRSEGIRRWTTEEGRPDRIGDYHVMDKLAIDPSRTGGLDFFRIARLTVVLIASDCLKRAMEEANLLGPDFNPVY